MVPFPRFSPGALLSELSHEPDMNVVRGLCGVQLNDSDFRCDIGCSVNCVLFNSTRLHSLY